MNTMSEGEAGQGREKRGIPAGLGAVPTETVPEDISARSAEEIFTGMKKLSLLQHEGSDDPVAQFMKGEFEVLERFVDIDVEGKGGQMAVLKGAVGIRSLWAEYIRGKELQRRGYLAGSANAQGMMVGMAWVFGERKHLSERLSTGFYRRIKLP